jgi:hypothetical protein
VGDVETAYVIAVILGQNPSRNALLHRVKVAAR